MFGRKKKKTEAVSAARNSGAGMAAPAKNTDGIQQQKAPDATSSGIGKPGEIKTAELPEEQKKPVILLERVNKSFDLGKTVVQILKDINVQIFPREFIVILGPSGSGKSTLLNTLLGLEPPSSGRVVMNNIDITRKKQDKIAKIRYGLFGIVFQRPEWVRSLSVVQNVALPLSINGTEKDKRMRIAWEKLKLIGMDTHGKYFPTELSGGQQQKVTLARALVNDPQVIIADEPTGNLDSASADRVMDLFKNLNERFHKTIIMVTHNIDYVRYASRTIYIRDGKVIEGSEQFLSG